MAGDPVLVGLAMDLIGRRPEARSALPVWRKLVQEVGMLAIPLSCCPVPPLPWIHRTRGTKDESRWLFGAGS